MNQEKIILTLFVHEINILAKKAKGKKNIENYIETFVKKELIKEDDFRKKFLEQGELNLNLARKIENLEEEIFKLKN